MSVTMSSYRTNESINRLEQRLACLISESNTLLTSLQSAQGYLDNAGRLEVSQNNALGDYTLDTDNLPLYFDTENIGTGTQSYNSTDNGQDLEVTTTGDAAIYQTKQWHPYFPGHAQQAEFTFIGFTPETDVVKRVGYFSSTTATPFSLNRDGFYLESSNGIVTLNIAKSGSINSIPQSDWLDPLDGTGASGITVNWDNFIVWQFDFLYLGGTYLNVYFIAEGKKHLIHRYNHANSYPTVIMNTPSQPIRAEIRSEGGAGSFTFVCAQVSTQGGGNDLSGTPFAVDMGTAFLLVSTATTEYVGLTLRKKDIDSRHFEYFLNNVVVTSSSGPGEAYRWRLHINPTLSATPTFNDLNTTYETGLQYGVGTGQTVTGAGYVIASDVGISRSSNDLVISRALRIGQEIAGTSDILVLAYTPYQNNQNFTAALNGVFIK